MAAISIQTLGAMTALNHTFASVSTGDTVNNSTGDVILLFKNSNASARTLTISGNAFSKPGYGDISAADAGETFTLPGSGTNGGECVIGLLPTARFNNASGLVTLTIDNTTGLTVAAVRPVRPA